MKLISGGQSGSTAPFSMSPSGAALPMAAGARRVAGPRISRSRRGCWRNIPIEGDAARRSGQRTEWNVRDADACLIIVDARGLMSPQGPRWRRIWRTATASRFTSSSGRGRRTPASGWLQQARHRRRPEACDRRAPGERSARYLRARQGADPDLDAGGGDLMLDSRIQCGYLRNVVA